MTEINLKWNEYDIVLRPHHVDSFITFKTKKLYLLSDEDFLKRFIKINWYIHNEKFILYWKWFLTKLYENQGIKFKYLYDYDTACENCDVIDQCKNNTTDLHKLVKRLDEEDLEKLWKLELWRVYTIKEIIHNMNLLW